MILSEGFAALFDGRRDIYGLGEGRVVKAPLTIAHYRDHLDGVGTGLGVFPLRQDGTVSFAAVDLDRPDYELGFQIANILPGVNYVERTRSDNVHVWSFYEEPVEAWVARGVMRAVLEALGEPKVEVFPKQDYLRDVTAFGNYINLPNFGDSRPILELSAGRYTELPLDAWVPDAWENRQDAATWEVRARALGVRKPDPTAERAAFGERAELHECAARIYRNRHSNPLVEGSRDVVLFNFAKQLLNWREIGVEEAREMVDEVNAAALPPLPESEVDRLFNNAMTKQYTSTGCDDPLMADYIDPNCPIARGARL